MRWIVTFALVGLVQAYTLLSRVSDYAHARSPWFPDLSVYGVPVGGTVFALGCAGVGGVALGLIPVARWFSLHTRLNGTFVVAVLGAIKAGIL